MINHYPILIWYNALLALSVGAAAGAMFTVETGIITLSTALILNTATLQLGWRQRQYENANKSLSEGVAALGLGAFLMLLFSSNLVVALGGLLYFMVLATNVTLRKHRQIYFGLMISFAYLLVGAAEATSGKYVFIFILYGFSASFCLAAIWLDGKANVVDTFAAPPAWQRSKAVFAILGLAVVIYLLMPRLPPAYIGSQQAYSDTIYTDRAWEQEAEKGNPSQTDQRPNESQDPPQDAPPKNKNSEDAYDYGGFADAFDINSTGDGDRNSNDIVAYMKAPHGIYLKARTFDQFDGARWSASSRETKKIKLEYGAMTLSKEPANFQQTIDIKANLTAWIPAAPLPVELHLPAGVIAVDAWQQPLLPGPLRAGTRYTVNSYVSFKHNRLSGSQTPPQPQDLQLPAEFDPRITELSRRVTDDRNSPLDKANALEWHLRTNYEYSFSSIFDSQGYTPLSKFLFETKQGHCEYFASAMAMMLRSIGIPARLTTGFAATQKNPLTGYYEIRALDGHAWVEAWIEGSGWLTFEPTAFYTLPKPQETTFSVEQINEYVENIERANRALGEGELSFDTLAASLWQQLYLALLMLFSYIKLSVQQAWPYLAVFITLAALAFLSRDHWLPQWQISLSLWRIRRYQPTQHQQALHFYLSHLQRIADHRHLSRSPHESIETWGARLLAATGATPAKEIEDQVNAVFYAQADIPLAQIKENAWRLAKGLHRLKTKGATSFKQAG